MDAYEKIRAVEYPQLPQPVQASLVSPPVISAEVEPCDDGFRLVDSESLDRTDERALVPKLGIKGWRDAGFLGVIYDGVNIRFMVERLLLNTTRPQNIIARAWLNFDLPLMLHLSPYIDFSEVSETRFLVGPDDCQRLSICLRGSNEQRFESALPEIEAFAKEITEHLPDDRRHILEVCLLPNDDIRLVEVNPGLTPQEFRALTEPDFD